MHKDLSRTIVAALLLSSPVAVPAWAQPQPKATPSPSTEVASSSYTAQATGVVTSVDQASGKLTLQTVDGPLTATFPSAAVQNVKKGDQVTVAIGLLENGPSASPSSSGSMGTQPQRNGSSTQGGSLHRF